MAEEEKRSEKYDPDRDYELFLEWYEENKTWLAGCHTERQAFYACWEEAREIGRLYERTNRKNKSIDRTRRD